MAGRLGDFYCVRFIVMANGSKFRKLRDSTDSAAIMRAGMADQTVFLFDVDNTLLDNDRVAHDLREHLGRFIGHQRQERYWALFEQIRAEVGYADYLGALQRYRVENPTNQHILAVSYFLLDYPFADRLYPGALEAIAAARQYGQAVILSDGDVVFQPHKIRRSGLLKAVGGNVLITIHKEAQLDEVERRFPADHYVMVDDKIAILTAMKKVWGERLTTVFPRQGHYALDAKIVAAYPKADVSVEHIGEIIPLLGKEGVSIGRSARGRPAS